MSKPIFRRLFMLTRIVVGVVAALFAVGMLAIRFTPVFPIVVAFLPLWPHSSLRELSVSKTKRYIL